MKKSARLFHFSSLQARLGAMLGALVLGVSVVLAVLLAAAAERQVLRQSASNLDVMSRQLARELATGMDAFAQAALTQSLQDRFRDPASTPAEMRGALDDFMRANPAFAYAAVVDAGTARVLAASGGIFEGGDLAGRPSYEEGRRGLFVGDVHDAVRLAELLPPPGNGEKLRFLDASAPIRDDSGRIVRVFATHIGWQWTERLRNDIFGPLKALQGVEALLVDSAGKVVLAATPDVPVGTVLDPVAGAPGARSRLVDWPDGRSYLTVSADTVPHGAFPGFGWRVVARQPAALATQAASHLRLAFMLAAIVLGCGGAVLAWWATGRLLLPVRQLGLHAADTQWAMGGATVDGDRAPSEVAGVRRAMARMARTTLDQTEARRLSERQFATLADSLPQRVFQADAAGLVDYVNQAWVTSSVDAAALARQPFETLFHPDSTAMLVPIWRDSLATGRPLALRCLLQPVGQSSARWYDVNARPLSDALGRARAWIGTLVDVHQVVTDARDAERALTLERSARAEAEKLGQLRDDFLATVSHELRSPLNVISGWSEILRRKGQDNPTALKAAEVIRSHARQQAALIDDLIDITAVTAGKMVLNLEPVDLTAVAAEVVSAQLPSAQLKGVALRCPPAAPCVVRGDRRRVFQIISNLVGNSLKFTEAGDSITVEVSRCPTRARCRSATPGAASLPSSCRTCSSACARRIRRRPAAPAGWVWACRSSRGWWHCTTARSPRPATARGVARCSRSPCRCTRRRRCPTRPIRGRPGTSTRPSRACSNCGAAGSCWSTTSRMPGTWPRRRSTAWAPRSAWPAPAPRCCGCWRPRPATSWSRTSACRRWTA